LSTDVSGQLRSGGASRAGGTAGSGRLHVLRGDPVRARRGSSVKERGDVGSGGGGGGGGSGVEGWRVRDDGWAAEPASRGEENRGAHYLHHSAIHTPQLFALAQTIARSGHGGHGARRLRAERVRVRGRVGAVVQPEQREAEGGG
jgi:hypothetical protein